MFQCSPTLSARQHCPTEYTTDNPEEFLPLGQHLTNGGQIQSTWELTPNNTLIAGADVWGRRLTTDRTKYITVDILNPEEEIIKTNHIVRGETPIPESWFTSSGLFVQNESRFLNENLHLYWEAGWTVYG
jgi:hemoglobin/transferrin/lactoferrin receptor protein